jgi:hypothetical protein
MAITRLRHSHARAPAGYAAMKLCTAPGDGAVGSAHAAGPGNYARCTAALDAPTIDIRGHAW